MSHRKKLALHYPHEPFLPLGHCGIRRGRKLQISRIIPVLALSLYPYTGFGRNLCRDNVNLRCEACQHGRFQAKT